LPKPKQKDDCGIWLAVVGLLSAIGIGGAVLMSQPKSNNHSKIGSTIQQPKKSGCGCGMKKH
jgi:preprotein translocase subunit SecG